MPFRDNVQDTPIVNDDSHRTRAGRDAAASPVRIRVRDLLDGGKEAVLELDGQDYRLRITSAGKLILTK